MGKSPLRSHEKALKAKDAEISRAQQYDPNTGEKDYDHLADLQRQRKDIVASHKEPNDPKHPDNESPLEMKSSPLHGYEDASDYNYNYQPTAHMWTKVFDAMGDFGKMLVEKRSDPEWKAKHQDKRADRIEKRLDKKTKKGKEGYKEAEITTTPGVGLVPNITVDRGEKGNKKMSKVQDLRKRAEANRVLAEENKLKESNDKLLNAYKSGDLTLAQYNALTQSNTSTNVVDNSSKKNQDSGLTFNDDGFSNELEFEDGSKRKIKKCSKDHFDQDKEGFKALGCKE